MLSTARVVRPLSKALPVRHLSSVPLTEELPGLPATSPTSKPSSAVEQTTLPNGLRIVSQDSHGAATKVGVYVRAGSRYEAVPGTAHFLEHMAFKTTFSRSSLKIQRDVEDFGGSVEAVSGRELISYTGSALRDNADVLVETLAETIMQPKLRYWEVDEEKVPFGVNAGEIESDSQSVVDEGLHAAAFGRDSAMGRSQFCRASGLGALDDGVLRSHLGAHFTAPNMVVAGSNIDHKELVGLLDMHMLEVPEGSATKAEPAQFQGGESHIRAEGGFSRLSLAISAPSSADLKGFVAAGVAQAILGETNLSMGTFHESSTQKRIPQAVAKASDGVYAAFSSMSPYSDVSLLTLSGVSADGAVGELFDIFTAVLNGTRSNVAADELARAKASLKLRLASSVEASGHNMDLGSQLLVRGAHVGLADTFAAVDAVTAADVQKVLTDGVAAGVALSTVGNSASLPRYDRILASLH